MEGAVKRDDFVSETAPLPDFIDDHEHLGLESNDQAVSSLVVLRSSMIHFSKLLFNRQIDGKTYLELMANSYEQIRKVLVKAVEEDYPESFFRVYAEVFSDPILTRLAVFLLYNHRSFDLSHDEARWCVLVMQGNIADAGHPPISKPQSEQRRVLEPERAQSSVEKASSASMTGGRKETDLMATQLSEKPSTAEEVQDEFTEIVKVLMKERDRLPERERYLVFLALLAISYCRGKASRSQLVQLGNEYLDKAVGLDTSRLDEPLKSSLKRLASTLKRRNLPSAIVNVLDKPKVLSSGRRVRIE
ncbi:MAG: hypothetical protein NZ988_04945 [Thaumarchaeota archaeon]|nr:hypothetical protein [Candidatus Calditenuaceae archaeon]MDW8187373.1 hypothetical protein [Nitrososphaerota archaeon]